ncbi:hypothetical protein [Staphylococcus xylosus]|uniref:hypothetical protein n=1 Tax=Staphylococcus xylosus TaxID=1288 RepID=UPI001CDC970F|nr:hypothetical protein [Staphylococcus xylosus]MCQ3816696.1 hypothetical protein [Staphylococcus xylosus]MCQ3819251.1 hypothetical protein [Staphylococcus xylosus]UBV36679.1 hypothetical protein JGY88_09455 [Staphylococcus xylosus]
MEIGKEYYVVMHEGRMYQDIVDVFADGRPKTRIINTTDDIFRAEVFEDYKDAIELANEYDLQVKKVRADILGLGSR